MLDNAELIRVVMTPVGLKHETSLFYLNSFQDRNRLKKYKTVQLNSFNLFVFSAASIYNFFCVKLSIFSDVLV